MNNPLERFVGGFAHAGLRCHKELAQRSYYLSVHLTSAAPGRVADVGVIVANVCEEFFRCWSHIAS